MDQLFGLTGQCPCCPIIQHQHACTDTHLSMKCDKEDVVCTFLFEQKPNTAAEYVAAHLSKIHGLDWHPDNEFILATSSQDNSVRVRQTDALKHISMQSLGGLNTHCYDLHDRRDSRVKTTSATSPSNIPVSPLKSVHTAVR